MFDVGAIKLSNSAWNNVVVLVRKKDGGLRFCIDFRCLNSHTKKDVFPLPRIHDMINALKGSKYYTTVDLLSGFWKLLWWLSPNNTQPSPSACWGFMSAKTCYLGSVMPHLIQDCLGELNYTIYLMYLDDVVIYSSTQEKHLDQLREVLEWFRLNGLKLKPSKCRF